MIPAGVQRRLRKIKSKSNSTYYEDKKDFVNKVYVLYDNYDDVYKNVSRYQVFRIFTFEPDLIDKNFLPPAVYNALYMLYDSALETL